MEKIKAMFGGPEFPYVAFLVAMLLILGAWKFGTEGLMD